MILVTSPSKPFSFTAKGTPRRQIIIKEYDPEIEALYAAAAETTQAGEVSPPESWKLLDVLDFVRLVVGRVAKTALADTDDFFQKGCDRLVSRHLEVRRLTQLHSLSLVCKPLGSATPSCTHCARTPPSTPDQLTAVLCISSRQWPV